MSLLRTFSTGCNLYARLRKRLQKKGTRSATHRLVGISGRERRLKQDANHVVSKRIVTRYPHSLIGLEELKDIRERTNRKRGKRASKKQRRANAAYSKWAYGELHASCGMQSCGGAWIQTLACRAGVIDYRFLTMCAE